MEARAPSEPSQPLASEVDYSRYEIETKLGEGGAGAVYLARDRETGDRVALKKLFRMDAKSVLRLKREFRSLVGIAHPNIVKLYDMGRGSDSWFLTMEYLEGVDLATYLELHEAAEWALCYAAVNVATTGAADADREVEDLLERAVALAQQLQSDYAFGALAAGRAISAFMRSRLEAVVQPSLEADRLLQAASAETPENDVDYDYFHRFALASVRIGARVSMGDMREASRELNECVRQAHATDNRALLLTLTLNRALCERAEGLVSTSRARLDAHALDLPKHRFGVLHVLHMAAVMFVAGTSLDFAWADRHTERLWQQWLRSPIRGSGYLTQMICISRTGLLLNRYFVERNPELLREVRRDLKLMAKNKAVAAGYVDRVQARLAFAAGDRQRAATLLRAAVERGTAGGLLSFVARDQYALGALTEGESGAVMRSSALARLSDLGFVDPVADVRATYPELVGT